jgi:hypothetical protein
VPISRREVERHEEEADTDDSNDDNDSDDDDDNNNIREQAETEHMVSTEPVQNRNLRARQRRITLGQRWCQTYLPEDQFKWYIISHRRALGVLLTASSDQDRRQRRLKPKLIKKANYLLKSKLRYLEFLRFMNSEHNPKRFQHFPEYKMGTKYFRIDAKILGQLRMATLTVYWETGKPFMQAARRRRSTINRALVGTNTNVDLWAEIFDLSGIQRDEQSKISMTTDGIGVSVTFGQEQDAEEDEEEEEEQEDDDDMEEDRDEELIDILTQLSTIGRDSYQEWIEYLRSYYSSFDLLHDWAALPFYRRWRRTREIKQERLRAEFKNALLCSQKRMPGMEKLNAPQRAPRQHIQPNERNVVAWGNGRFGNRKGQAPMPNVGHKSMLHASPL